MRRLYSVIVSLFFLSLAGQNDTLKLLGPKYNFFKSNVSMYNEYLDIDGEGYNTTNFRYKTPIFKGDWNLRVDIPIISYELVGENGLGDISISVGHILSVSKDFGAWIKESVSVPTASTENLGYGKWIFSSTLGLGKKVGKNMLYLVSYAHKISFAGQSDRNGYHRGNIDTSLTYSLKSYWLTLNPSAYFDYKRNAKVLPALALDMGKSISSGTSVYIHPSIGIGENRTYNSGFEFGLVTTW